MYIKNKRGQSTVEYVLLVTAVIAVIIALVAGNGKGGFQSQLNSTLNAASQEMGTMSSALAGSYNTAITSNGTPSYNVSVNPGNSQ